MTAALNAKSNGTQGSLLVNGTESVVFDSTGIVSGAGKRVAQIQSFQTGAVATGTTIVPFDDTIPQNTEGDQYMSLAITPQNASSTLEITVTAVYSTAATANTAISLFQDSTANALSTVSYVNSANAQVTATFTHLMTAGTTSLTTFKVRIGNDAGTTTTFNGTANNRKYGGVVASRITIKEYLP